MHSHFMCASFHCARFTELKCVHRKSSACFFYTHRPSSAKHLFSIFLLEFILFPFLCVRFRIVHATRLQWRQFHQITKRLLCDRLNENRAMQGERRETKNESTPIHFNFESSIFNRKFSDETHIHIKLTRRIVCASHKLRFFPFIFTLSIVVIMTCETKTKKM